MSGSRPADVVRVALTAESYKSCSRTLQPGQVKRVLQRGPLVGYIIACPACGFAGTFLHESCHAGEGSGFVERPTGPLAPGQVRELVSTTRDAPCFRCRRSIRVVAGTLEAWSC